MVEVALVAVTQVEVALAAVTQVVAVLAVAGNLVCLPKRLEFLQNVALHLSDRNGKIFDWGEITI